MIVTPGIGAGERGADAADDARQFVHERDVQEVALARLDFAVAVAGAHDRRRRQLEGGVGDDEDDIVEEDVRVEDAELESARGEDAAIGQAGECALNGLGRRRC